MELNEHHRRLLSMRTHLNKFAVQAGYKVGPLPEALRDLINNGYVIQIDTYFNFQYRAWLDVYRLTPEGAALVEREKIIAVSP